MHDYWLQRVTGRIIQRKLLLDEQVSLHFSLLWTSSYVSFNLKYGKFDFCK